MLFEFLHSLMLSARVIFRSSACALSATTSTVRHRHEFRCARSTRAPRSERGGLLPRFLSGEISVKRD